MGYLPTPHDKYGLVDFPLSRECPHVKDDQLDLTRCFLSYHHLYFYQDLYESGGPDSLLFRLRNDPFNRIPIARCQHDLYEELYLPPEFPKDSVIIEYLHQAGILRGLGDAAMTLARNEINLDNLHNSAVPEWTRMRQLREKCNKSYEEIRELGKTVVDLELLPHQTKMNPFDHIYLENDQSEREVAIQIVHSVVNVDALRSAA
jgi:hypothetical protein